MPVVPPINSAFLPEKSYLTCILLLSFMSAMARRRQRGLHIARSRRPPSRGGRPTRAMAPETPCDRGRVFDTANNFQNKSLVFAISCTCRGRCRRHSPIQVPRGDELSAPCHAAGLRRFQLRRLALVKPMILNIEFSV